MISIVFGSLCLLFVGFAIIPFSNGIGLRWMEEFLYVLKGVIPLFAIGLGGLCIFIGLIDLSDKRYAKKEAELQKKIDAQNQETTNSVHTSKNT